MNTVLLGFYTSCKTAALLCSPHPPGNKVNRAEKTWASACCGELSLVSSRKVTPNRETSTKPVSNLLKVLMLMVLNFSDNGCSGDQVSKQVKEIKYLP